MAHRLESEPARPPADRARPLRQDARAARRDPQRGGRGLRLIFWRSAPYNRRARDRELGGALWFPRELQGAGRHDNPDLYGCVYGAMDPLSVVVEALAPFRASGNLSDSMLVRSGLRLGLSGIDVDVDVLDLDDPAVLRRERLRPSQVATRYREVTQPWAARLYEKHTDVGALVWWSTLEASWQNVTVFDRAARKLRLRSTAVLTLDHPVVREAADFLGLNGRRR